MRSSDLDAIIGRIIGDAPTFFQTYWRRKPLHVPGAGASCADAYSVEDFLADRAATQEAPYVSVTAREGKWVYGKHLTMEDLRQAVAAGGVTSMKLSKLWHGPIPSSWQWMRALFGSLCRAVAMTYLSPTHFEDVDVFLAGPQSGLGSHFDVADVFTLQVSGERRWTVDSEVHLDSVMAHARERGWSPGQEIDFQGPTCEVTLRPGDCLYVPAFAVHNVTGVSWSVSLSLGLRAFNEIDFLEHLLGIMRRTRYLSYPPCPSVAEAAGEAHVQAKMELMRRVRSFLGQVEGLALTTLLAPLHLPEVFAQEGPSHS